MSAPGSAMTRANRIEWIAVGDVIRQKDSDMDYTVQSVSAVGTGTVTLRRNHDGKVIERTLGQVTDNWRMVKQTTTEAGG